MTTRNISYYVSVGTRQVQYLSPRRPVGLTSLSRYLEQWLPPFTGVITLENEVQMQVDTRAKMERELFYAGDRHRVLTYYLRKYTPSGGYCLDVGANIGFYALKFARWVGPAGKVVAFEANPAMVARIEQNRQLNHFDQLTIEARAVHNQAGKLQFYITADPVLSSLDDPTNAQQVIEVETVRLDDYLRDAGWPRLDVIKLDIEGYDCQALLGARHSLEKFRPVITFEYSGTADAAAEELFHLLDHLGYTLYGLVLRTGAVHPIDWRSPGHYNVLCLPANQQL